MSGRRQAGMSLSQRRYKLGMKPLVETVHGGRGKGADYATPVPFLSNDKRSVVKVKMKDACRDCDATCAHAKVYARVRVYVCGPLINNDNISVCLST